jgi:hypothetical protein
MKNVEEQQQQQYIALINKVIIVMWMTLASLFVPECVLHICSKKSCATFKKIIYNVSKK